MSKISRQFTSQTAVREKVPLLIGLVGASGCGKTMSALRLASGIGGITYFIDSEARRSLWYADKFQFQHVEFKAPFGPLDYLQAIEYCISKGAETIIVDSMSHSWEGPGGVLEMHDAEQERLALLWKCSRDKANMAAWQVPKRDEKRMLNTILQMPVNFIFCFRAKEKISMTGDKPKPMGWMPISSEALIYEMSLNCLLMPNSGGVPSWHPDEMGEKAIIKLPEQFKPIFARSQPLSEDIGKQLSQWARGGEKQTAPRSSPQSPIRDFSFRLESGKLKLTKQASGDLQIVTPDGEIFSTPAADDFIEFAKTNKNMIASGKHIDGQIEFWNKEVTD